MALVLAVAPEVSGTNSDPADAATVEPATREMAALLVERAEKVRAARLPFAVNDRRVEILAEELTWPRPIRERLQLGFSYAAELLNAGRVQESLDALEELRLDGEKNALDAWRADLPAVLVQKGVAYLRMAEMQNCCQAANRDSCLLPIRGGGVHQQREGATRAAETLKTVLDLYPTHPTQHIARWLLNIAHMTLGAYPDGVPAAYRIPPSAFASEYPLAPFRNVASDVGVDLLGLAGGTVLEDFDNDGLLDLMFSSQGLKDQLRLLWNKGDGHFEDGTARAGLTGEVGGLNLIHADYDNDGFADVLVLRGGWMATEGRFPLSLLRNKGDGTFADVTRAAGLLRLAPSQTATWLDYDGDGWLDLYVGNESAPLGSDPDDVHPCELFHNNRDGTFTNLARETGVDFVGFVKGVTAGDYDNDGRPDLYVSVRDGDNLLYHNDGPARGAGAHGWRFTERAAEAGVREPRLSFGTFFFDYDNDGWQDLFVMGYGWSRAEDPAADFLGLPSEGERSRLYRNKGDGSFEDVTKATGLYRVLAGMGLNFGDLDNDGFLDFYVGTGDPEFTTLVPNRMFRNDSGRRFQDVTTAGNFGHLQKGHGIAFGDVDNDGDQDVVAKMGGAFLADKAFSTLYENPGNGNRWLGLELTGARSNRSAIGARITVIVEEAGSGLRRIHSTVGTGGSFGSSPLRRELGLGAATRIAAVEVFWPASGLTQKLTGLSPGHRYRIREGEDTVVLAERRGFTLGSATKAAEQIRALTREISAAADKP